MKSIDIKGKQYVTVNERLIYFREKYPDHALTSEIVELTEERVVMKATIQFGDVVYATGHAYEDKDSTFINKTSFIENCETSAWGRCLAAFGIGIEEGVASFEEVANAVVQKDDKPWMSHKDFSTLVRSLNEEPSDSRRAILYKAADDQFRMKKDYRKQLLEIVEQRDINV
jgi:hypothetical protein